MREIYNAKRKIKIARLNYSATSLLLPTALFRALLDSHEWIIHRCLAAVFSSSSINHLFIAANFVPALLAFERAPPLAHAVITRRVWKFAGVLWRQLHLFLLTVLYQLIAKSLLLLHVYNQCFML